MFTRASSVHNSFGILIWSTAGLKSQDSSFILPPANIKEQHIIFVDLNETKTLLAFTLSKNPNHKPAL